MNKICTDIPQSKKLIELEVDVDTSDMVYLRSYFEDEGEYNLLIGSYHEGYMEKDDGTLIQVFDEHIPAWSLSALLSVLPKEIRLVGSTKDHYWYCECINAHDSNWYAGFESSDNPVDACYGMIVKLHEQKLL